MVHDALGTEVWRDDAVPGVSGNATVVVEYGGPELTPGMYYRFTATSWKDGNPAPSALSGPRTCAACSSTLGSRRVGSSQERERATPPGETPEASSLTLAALDRWFLELNLQRGEALELGPASLDRDGAAEGRALTLGSQGVFFGALSTAPAVVAFAQLLLDLRGGEPASVAKAVPVGAGSAKPLLKSKVPSPPTTRRMLISKVAPGSASHSPVFGSRQRESQPELPGS